MVARRHEGGIRCLQKRTYKCLRGCKAIQCPAPLSDRMLGKVSLKATTGHPLSLTSEEEASIVSYVEYMHERRFPITRSQVISLAWAVDLKRESGRAFGENGPSLNWWRGFRNRHRELTFHTTESIDRGRVVNANEEGIGQYFDLLKQTTHEHRLEDKPHLIFNCDESAIVGLLSKSAKKVLVPRSTKHCHSIANASTQHVSVLCCFSAAGYAMPPMIVFSKGLPAGRFHKDGPVNASYSSSKSGFVDKAIYTEWFKKTFLKFAPTERPLLLLQDGASAHMGPDLIEAAIANDVVLLCFPPKTTHLLQPCDVGLYRTMKSQLRRTMQQVKMLRGELGIQKHNIPAIFREVFLNSFTAASICKAFETCCIHPFNRNAISKELVSASRVRVDIGKHQQNCSLPVDGSGPVSCPLTTSIR